ncbi:MAG: FtsB family cell division protein [Desulfovibrionales bacterium]
MLIWRSTACLLLLLNLFLGYQAIWSPTGYMSYLELRKSYEEVQRRLDTVDEENRVLSREIRTLRNDRDYLEKVIRTQMHLLKENEVLYLFPSNRQAGDSFHE